METTTAQALEEAPRRHSIEAFIRRTGERDRGEGFFELETDRVLEVNLAPRGMVWSKLGSMVAYQGGIKFTREGVLEHGVGKMFRKALTGEGARLTKAEGSGRLYLADAGKKVSIIELDGEALCVNGNDILAFEGSVAWEIRMMRKVSAMLSGGLFNVRLEGHGMVAVTTHYDPVTLRVTPGDPVVTDPNATVAWSAGLTPKIRTDLSLKSFLGRGSGESIQTEFEGDGFVVIQPFEEVVLRQGSAG